MTYRELADCLRLAKQIKLPYEDYEIVRMFAPKSVNNHLLDLMVADSTTLADFNRLLFIYLSFVSPYEG
jgi:hypothetical protein